MSERVYAFYPVFEAPGFDAVDLDQATKGAEHLFEELADKGGTVRGIYSTVGFRADSGSR